MNQTELHNLLKTYGHDARISKEEVLVNPCFFCGNTSWNLELNAARGVYHCWACHASGTLNALLRQRFSIEDAGFKVNLGDDQQAFDWTVAEDRTAELGLVPPKEVPMAQHYLQRRGLDELTMRRFGIAVCNRSESPYACRIVLPLRDYWDQRPVGMVARTYMGKYPKYLTDMPAKRIVGWRRRSGNVHVLVEGAFDAIQVSRSGLGAAALLGTSNPEVAEWAARVPTDHLVVVMLDGAAADSARSIYHTIRTIVPRTHVHLATLPEGLDPGGLDVEVISRYVHTLVTKPGPTQTVRKE